MIIDYKPGFSTARILAGLLRLLVLLKVCRSLCVEFHVS